jgi:acyl carrier protein
MLDAVVAGRRAAGSAAVSIAWGPWAEGGMADGDLITRRHSRGGLRALPPEFAVRALARVVGAADGALTVVADVDWDRFAVLLDSAGRAGILRGVAEAARALSAPTSGGQALPGGPSGGEGRGALREALAQAPVAQRAAIVLDAVLAQAAAVLGHGRAGRGIGPEQAFRDLGFDSLTALELRNGLGALAGIPLPATLVFDYPTPADLASYLVAELDDGRLPEVSEALDRLGAVLSEISLDPDAASVARDRLRGMLATLGEPDGDRAISSQHASTTTRLDAASDEELFAFIQEEFGRS